MQNKIFFWSIIFYAAGLHAWSTVYFTPRDDLRQRLIELINQEQKSIDCAVYMFTEKTIAQALLNAYIRGVKVRVILDQISMGEKYGKGLFLKNNGVDVVVFAEPEINAYLAPIMHHKFFVFGYNSEHKKSLVWTGSYNCTSSASRLHHENAVVIDDGGVIAHYQSCFVQLFMQLKVDRCGSDILLELSTEDEVILPSAHL